MKKLVSTVIMYAASILKVVVVFGLFILMIVIISSPFLIIDHFTNHEKTTRHYAPEDANKDGIVTSAEDEDYNTDLSEQYNGK